MLEVYFSTVHVPCNKAKSLKRSWRLLNDLVSENDNKMHSSMAQHSSMASLFELAEADFRFHAVIEEDVLD